MSRRGHLHTAVRSLEHRHLDAFFKLANAAAELGLSKQESLSSPPKAPVMRACHGISEMLQVDSGSSAMEEHTSRLRGIVLHCAPLQFSYPSGTSFALSLTNGDLTGCNRNRFEDNYRHSNWTFTYRIVRAMSVSESIDKAANRSAAGKNDRRITVATLTLIGCRWSTFVCIRPYQQLRAAAARPGAKPAQLCQSASIVTVADGVTAPGLSGVAT